MKRFLPIPAGLLCLTFSAAVLAADSVPSPGANIAQMLLGLGVVLVLLYGTLHLLRRLQTGGGRSQAASLKVIAATSVGPRERVVLVAVGKQVLVLGVAPGRVNMLHNLEASELPQPNPAEPASQDFASRLKQLIERGRDAR